MKLLVHGQGKVAVSHAHGVGKVDHYVVKVGDLATDHPDMTREFHEHRGYKPALIRAEIHADRLRRAGWAARIIPAGQH